MNGSITEPPWFALRKRTMAPVFGRSPRLVPRIPTLLCALWTLASFRRRGRTAVPRVAGEMHHWEPASRASACLFNYCEPRFGAQTPLPQHLIQCEFFGNQQVAHL